MGERDRSKQEPADRKEDARHSAKGTGAGVDYEDSRGDRRYVGGGREGGQNFANEGYGANQSYSAGPGYQQADGVDTEGGNASEQEFAVEPSDLGVRDYDLQGSYGRPAVSEKPQQPARKSDSDRR